MEDPEPEQKRIKRIAEHIEDEIDRAQYLPLEELTRHKAAMVHMLQFLNIEQAYAVSLVSRRIYEWFQQNDIWYALAQRWLTPARLAQCEAWVEQVKPKGKRINYLWMLLGERAMWRWERRISDDYFSIDTVASAGYYMFDMYGKRLLHWQLGVYDAELARVLDDLPRARLDNTEDKSDFGKWHGRFIPMNPAQLLYYIMSIVPEARVSAMMLPLRIRSKLGN